MRSHFIVLWLAAAMIMIFSSACLQPAFTVIRATESPGAVPTVATSTASPGSSPAATPPAPPTAVVTGPKSLLVWNGKGVNVTDLECLISGLLRQGIKFDLVNEADLTGMTAAELASHLGLMFPDGTTSTVFAQLPPNVVAIIQDAVKNLGLHLVAVGGSSGVPTQMGLTPQKPNAGSILQIIQLVLQGVSLFIPQTAIISTFLTGLPALVQLISGQGAVSMLAPQSNAPSCGGSQATSTAGNGTMVDPLQALLGLIQHYVPKPKSAVPVAG